MRVGTTENVTADVEGSRPMTLAGSHGVGVDKKDCICGTGVRQASCHCHRDRMKFARPCLWFCPAESCPYRQAIAYIYRLYYKKKYIYTIYLHTYTSKMSVSSFLFSFQEPYQFLFVVSEYRFVFKRFVAGTELRC